MKITILSRYSRLGASSRLRTMQYIPALEAAGFDVNLVSFFDDAYLKALYAGKRDKGGLRRFTLARLSACRAARHADMIWVEKEALPWFPWMLEKLALPKNVPIVSDYDDAVFHRYDQHRNPVIRGVLGRKIDRVMGHSRLVTAGNAYLAERAQAAGAKWVEIVPTVVDVDAYLPTHDRKTDQPLRIGWVGTPQTWEKYGAPRAAFFQELAHANNARFQLVGARLAAGQEGAFDYIPWSEAGEVAAIQSMDIGIMPLLDDCWERGKCGYKLIQYMACGIPVIASPIGVNSQIVTHGENGFLARSGQEWDEALCKLLGDDELRRSMGVAGRQKVDDCYSIQVQGPRVASLFAKIIQGSR